jgi:hypothetical protein
MPDATYADEYAKFYAYNMKDIDQNDARLEGVHRCGRGLIEKNGRPRW